MRAAWPFCDTSFPFWPFLNSNHMSSGNPVLLPRSSEIYNLFFKYILLRLIPGETWISPDDIIPLVILKVHLLISHTAFPQHLSVRGSIFSLYLFSLYLITPLPFCVSFTSLPIPYSHSSITILFLIAWEHHNHHYVKKSSPCYLSGICMLRRYVRLPMCTAHYSN